MRFLFYFGQLINGSNIFFLRSTRMIRRLGKREKKIHCQGKQISCYRSKLSPKHILKCNQRGGHLANIETKVAISAEKCYFFKRRSKNVIHTIQDQQLKR